MRILLAAHQFFPEHSAGVETVALGVARELKARGHEAHVLAPRRSEPGGIRPGQVEDYEYGGIPVRRIGRPEEGFSRPYRLNYRNETMARRTREYMKTLQPDIVHAMHLQGLSADVLPVFKEFGVPLVYTATDFWTICPVVDLRRHDGVMCRGPELHHCIRCVASRDPGSRMNAAVGRVPDTALKAAGLLSRTPLTRASHPLRQIGDLRERAGYIREKMDLVDRIIAYTQLTRDMLLANGIGEGKIEVSTYGIDTSEIVKVSKNRDPSSTLRVGFIGTLAPHKGCDILIRALSLLTELDVTLAIHGDPGQYAPYAEELRALAANDSRIDFRGAFSRPDIGRVLSEIDVLGVPSRWYENAPGVIYEAFAAGVPVLATDLGGMSEVVVQGENGLLFGLERPEDLARQLRRVVEKPGLLEKLRAGIGPVKTVEENVDELEGLYGGLREERGLKHLIVGGNGFIGGHLAWRLGENGGEVRVYDRSPGKLRAGPPGAEYVEGELGNHGLIREAVSGVEVVYHFVSTTLPKTSNDDPIYDVRSNLVDTIQLLESCVEAGVRKVIFASSGGTVYGPPETLPITEDHPTAPISSYGIVKLAIEKYLSLFHHLYGLDYAVLRISNPYGPYQDPGGQQGAVGVFLNRLYTGRPITIWGDGEVVRDYLYVSDLVDALELAALIESREKVLNIGSGEGLSLNALIRCISEVVGEHPAVEYLPARPLDVPASVLNVGRAKSALGWEPETGLAEGIERTWAWIQTLSNSKVES